MKSFMFALRRIDTKCLKARVYEGKMVIGTLGCPISEFKKRPERKNVIDFNSKKLRFMRTQNQMEELKL